MFKHKMHESVSLKVYLDWFLLAFLGGSVNAGGFLACQRFVTHVTGFATLAGIDLASGELAAAFGMLTVPVFFLAGVMVAAYLTDRRVLEGKRPRYELVMSMVTFFLFLSVAGGVSDWFGPFGGLQLGKDYSLLAILCLASGLQNAALTSASGATIRTTHLTGLTTDLGIGLVRAAGLAAGDKNRSAMMKMNYLRIGTIVSFMAGSGVGAYLYLRFGYLGFLLPMAIAAYAAAVARKQSAA